MRKKGRIALVILATAILGFLAWGVLHYSKITYKGKSLTFWLKCYTPAGGELEASEQLQVEADKAVRSIGTYAIPTLLRRLRAPSPPFPPLKLKLIAMAQKLRLLRKDYPLGDEMNQQGVRGFLALGEAAKDAVPQLIAMYEQNINQYLAASVLSAIGPEAQKAIPLLMRRATDTNLGVRYTAVRALGGIHAHPKLVVPCLTNALYDPSELVRRSAAEALGNYGEKAKLAVPALLEMIKGPDLDDCLASIRSLGKIHSEPDLVVPALIKLLYEGNSAASAKPNAKWLVDERGRNNWVRRSAAEALRGFGEEAKPAVPALLDQLKDPDPMLSSWSMQTLVIIHAEPELVVPALVEALDNPDYQVYQSAAMALGGFRGDAKSAVPKLLSQISNQGPFFNPAAYQTLKIIDPEGQARRDEDKMRSIRSR